jgi:alcohol dehydrogenase
LIRRDAARSARFTPDMLIDEVKQLNADLGIPRTFSELGVKQDLIPELIKDALRTKIYTVVPRQTKEEDIKQLYVRSIG